MAKQLNYTVTYPDGESENYPASYWRCVSVNTCKEDGSGQVVFYGFPSAALKGTRVVGRKAYDISAAQYAAFAEASLSAITAASAPRPVVSLQDAILKQSYLYANSILDVDSGQKDEGGNPIMRSFFSGSIDV